MKRVLVLGATSAIAQAVARRWAGGGAHCYLVGRDPARTEAVAQDLSVRSGANATWEALDLRDCTQHGAIMQRAVAALGAADIVLLAHGVLSDAHAAEDDIGAAVAAFEANATSVVSLCLHAAAILERQGHGTLAILGSVAGDRGRRSNYPYGAAKAAVATFAAGLRYRLRATGVRVVLLKPGPIRTPMTAHLPDGALLAPLDAAASGICNAIARGKAVAYVPWYWRWIMLVLRLLPDPIFRRLPL